MISLDDPDWSILEHAYGPASDIPEMLRQLANYPDNPDHEAEPYFGLWSALCHQGDTYTAAYAATPHVLALADAAPDRISNDYLLLPICIDIARASGRGPGMPDELARDYFESVRSIPRIVGKMDPNEADETLCLACAAGIAAAGGLYSAATVILELDSASAKDALEWLAMR